MRFYTNTHTHYCGIDLHAKTMYLCILDREGEILLHKNMRSRPESFLDAVAPYRDDLVVAVGCSMRSTECSSTTRTSSETNSSR